MEKYWSPDEPNTLRYPKPEGKESFLVDLDTFVFGAAEVQVIDGKKVLVMNPERIAQVEAEKLQAEADKAQAIQEKIQAEELQKKLDEQRSQAFASIDQIKDIEGVKTILKLLAGVPIDEIVTPINPQPEPVEAPKDGA